MPVSKGWMDRARMKLRGLGVRARRKKVECHEGASPRTSFSGGDEDDEEGERNHHNSR